MTRITITAAAYANPERTAAVIQTAEAGAVAISAADTPAVWAQMLARGGVAAYQPPPGPSYRDLRARAYRDELGADAGDTIRTIGDVLDVLIAEVRAAVDAPRTPEFMALLAKIDAIKARYPKP